MPFITTATLEQLFEAVQKELAEKDVMIDWLGYICFIRKYIK